MNVWKVLFCELKVFYCVQYCFLWPVYVWRSPLNSLEISKLRTLTVLRFQSAVLGLAAQSCPTLCNPMDCSLPGSSVHRIPQARTLEWVDVPFSSGSSQPRDQTQVFCISGRFFTTEPPGNLVEVYNLRKHLTTYKFLVVYFYISLTGLNLEEEIAPTPVFLPGKLHG